MAASHPTWQYTKRKFFDPNAVPGAKDGAEFKTPMHVVKAVMKGMVWGGGEDAHRELLLPVLLLAGINDSFVEPREMREMHHFLRLSRLVFIPDAGHFVIMEQVRRGFGGSCWQRH